MKWQEVREQYPQQWLLIEAIQAHTEKEKRILDQISVINTFPDSRMALKNYSQLHRDSPRRELYVLHTDRKDTDINFRIRAGVRGRL